jgi:Rrf2 family protein
MLSKKAKYALQAVLHLARREAQGPVLIAAIAAEERIPKKFLESILLTLKNRGILQSRKGKGGGYALARPAGEISFGEVIRVLDGPLAPVPCVSATAYRRCEECRDEGACAIRLVMQEARDALASVLDAESVADAVRRADRAGAGRRPRKRG